MLEGADVCFAPVLDWDEAPQHPHHVARNTFIEVDGVVQPALALRFSRTVAPVRGSAVENSADEMLEARGVFSQTLQTRATPACTGAA